MELLNKPIGEIARDWRNASPGDLVEHIVKHFHRKHRQHFPELMRLARRIEVIYENRPECPHGLVEHLAFMEQDMESHMMKEEQILFPMLLRGLYRQALPPILRMRHEHDQHTHSLTKLAELTNHCTPPQSACHTWHALYDGLSQLRDDLMAHIQLENDVLFPMVEKDNDPSLSAPNACAVCRT